MAEIREISILGATNLSYLHEDQEYRIVREWEVNGRHYAMLQPVQDHPDDSFLFRVNNGQVEEIESETEWEGVVDAIDEYLRSHDK